MAEVIDVVDDFAAQTHLFVESDEFDDYEKIPKALESAREKYGVNFQGNEAKLLFDKNGEYVEFSMPINIQGTFNKSTLVWHEHFPWIREIHQDSGRIIPPIYPS